MQDSVKLKKSLFGFKKKSVIEYINEISKNIDNKLFLKDNEIKKLKKNIEELKEQNNTLNKTIDDFKSEKEKIAQMYINAQETSESIINDANIKAESLLFETEEKIRKNKEQARVEQDRLKLEYDKQIEEQKAAIEKYKAEVNSLKSKIKLTLSNFDNILSDLTNN